VIEQITNGGGGMPAFGDQLSTEEIAAIADHVANNIHGG
jgi:mono/diheme cytochrome c family protein